MFDKKEVVKNSWGRPRGVKQTLALEVVLGFCWGEEDLLWEGDVNAFL
jgi:hypothetical protein